MFKRNQKKESDFDFDIEIAPVDTEEYGTEEEKNKGRWTKRFAVGSLALLLVGGIGYTVTRGGDEVAPPVKSEPSVTDTTSVTEETENPVAVPKKKEVKLYNKVPEGFVVYSNGFLGTNMLIKSDWVVYERLQESMNEVSPFLKEGVFNWEKANFKRDIPIVDVISPDQKKPSVLHVYLESGKQTPADVAKLFSVSAKSVSSKASVVTHNKKKLRVTTYTLKDFSLLVTATKIDVPIAKSVISVVLVGDKGKAYSKMLPSLYETASSIQKAKR